jgi:chromatin structure-remodeling complex subunit RSC1/2
VGIGDWVHIQNPNDPSKPIVAQIFRIWETAEGQGMFNACWYYRPEQTIHRFDHCFYENEVLKTGQYRDHAVEEIVDRCFVMFITRYSRGRPQGFPLHKQVYVCESRYNEERHRISRIKTWSSCQPDEVRAKDVAMDLFTTPYSMHKIPSPLLHTLPPNAKATDPMPHPTWGARNAPPIVGAVHMRPLGPNVCIHFPFLISSNFIFYRTMPRLSFLKFDLRTCVYPGKLIPSSLLGITSA